MITIEQVIKIIEEESMWLEFLIDPNYLDYTDLLDFHRTILDNLWLSFWIWELIESNDSSITLIYTWNWENNMKILSEWLPNFKDETESLTLDNYVKWLNEIEDKSLQYNK